MEEFKKGFYSITKRLLIISLMYLSAIYISLTEDRVLGLKFYNPWLPAIGHVLIFSSIIIMMYSVYLLVKIGKGSPDPLFPTKLLVTKGLYRYVRHPIYSAAIILLLGFAFVFSSPFLVILTMLSVFLLPLYIKKEEEDLIKRFGKKYLKYKKKIGMLIPKTS